MADTAQTSRHSAPLGANAGTTAVPKPTVPLSDRWYRLRNRVLKSPAFQRWSEVFPLSRPIARYHSRALYDLCAGFIYSQILMTSVKLDLFRPLADQPLPLAALAQHTGLAPNAVERVLRAGIALKLFEAHGEERYGLGILGAALLGNPGVLAMIAHHEMAYADLRDPIALLKGDRSQAGLAQYWGYASTDAPEKLTAADVSAYTELMSTSQQLIAEDILDAYPFGTHKSVLDVGGGDGAFLAAVGQRHAALHLTLFDLPAVADKARERFSRLGLGARSNAVGGDFTATPLPRGADVVTLVRVLLDHDDARCAALLAQIHQAMAPGTTLVMAEPIGGLRGAETVGDAYFGFYLLAMGKGRARSFNELKALLAAAGFKDVAQRATRRPLMTGLLTARRA